MPQHRDLNRTRERIIAAAQKEFAANGFAGARTDAIARRAGINERMIFYCFNSKEGLYRAVLAQKLSARARIIESTPDEDFTSNLVNGFAATCASIDALRVLLTTDGQHMENLRTEFLQWFDAIGVDPAQLGDWVEELRRRPDDR